jgi:hypothetical protein
MAAQGLLFSQHFLDEGIRQLPEYGALESDSAFAVFQEQCRRLFAAFPRDRSPIEQQTEDDLIVPVLALLGWSREQVLRQQQAAKSKRSDVPDILLFADLEAKERALRAERPDLTYRHGVAIVESKRWQRPLDRAPAARSEDSEVPSTQILRYLSRAEVASNRAIAWGMLTNGRLWRLYWQLAKSRSEEYLEVDLLQLLDLPDERDLLTPDAATRQHWLRVFYLLFACRSFRGPERFHALALEEGRRWEAKVAADLSVTVFRTLFPTLVAALARADAEAPRPLTDAYLVELKQAALTLLYRLLFLLYAEDRDLLPTRDKRYDDYSLWTLREDIARRIDSKDVLSGRATRYWRHVADLCRMIDRGDDAVGLPEYNGGLFQGSAAPILDRVELPDSDFAPLVDALSRRQEGGSLRHINFRDLSVQQLGSIYERLLEFELRTQDGAVIVVGDDAERHGTGSYYTPEPLVQLILSRAVGPVLDEIWSAFLREAERLAGDRRPRAERLRALAEADPAQRALAIRVCDPAMGSGHFLVSLVDYLSDRLLEFLSTAPSSVDFADEIEPYRSPLLDRIARIRAHIRALAERRGWAIDEAQLDDRRLVRRMILKRVVHGVDKNPMAVELAKVSLWLHTFTVGAPLSFLDHHLRCGDSLLGAWVRPTADWLERRGGLLANRHVQQAQRTASAMDDIEQRADADLAEVEASKDRFATMAEAVAPLGAFLDLIQSERLLGVFESAPARRPKDPDDLAAHGAAAKTLARARADIIAFRAAAAFKNLLDGSYGDPVRLATGELRIEQAEPSQPSLLPPEPDSQASLLPGAEVVAGRAGQDRELAAGLLQQARERADAERFLHWELTFPNVWQDWMSAAHSGGFDAIIGNPPYVRQESLGAIKPVLKAAYESYDGVADLYVYFYELALRLLKPGGRLSYVVTNKWFRAGYAEKLRGLFGERAWLDLVVDFGHARGFFPGTDVFPSVIVARRPDSGEPPQETRVCVVPRDLVRYEDLLPQVEAGAFPLPRAAFTREAWVLEPPDVRALMDKIRRNGVPLAEYAGCKPLYGIKTGLNEAFLIDQATRDRLVADDPKAAEVIKPCLRGGDIQRWHSPPSGTHMIVTKSSGGFSWPWSGAGGSAEEVFCRAFPSLYKHFKPLETRLRQREDQGAHWWELRACAYYDSFEAPKILYQVIQYYPQYMIDDELRISNDKTFLVPTSDLSLLATLNSPLLWWFNWRYLPHMKDEALNPAGDRMEDLPIAGFAESVRSRVQSLASRSVEICKVLDRSRRALVSWYAAEHEVTSPTKKLLDPFHLSFEDFTQALRKARKTRPFNAARLAAVQESYHELVWPGRGMLQELARLEHELSDLVNRAYGLTDEEVALMWRTAPPRMPIPTPSGT